MSLTAAQREAIAARGNVLVVAGAGTGKTSTLVERCLSCLLTEKPRVSLDEILMVTFTEAAAAEMRQRIRERLEQERDARSRESHWAEQLALFETAHIGTLHSFCFQLVRQHFYELELDPQLAILAEEEAQLLAEETLSTVLQTHYGGAGAMAESVQDLVQAQAAGNDQKIRGLVLKLHRYSQTLPDPALWLEAQQKEFASDGPVLWRRWLHETIPDWSRRWIEALGENSSNGIANECVRALKGLDRFVSCPDAAAGLQAIVDAGENYPHGKKGIWHDPLKPFLKEAKFLLSLTTDEGTKSGLDPLAQDWDWVRDQMSTLLRLSKEFTSAYTENKRELGMVDFQDLEQYALRLLWNSNENKPTKTALQWRKQLKFVFVDEYQDINAAQDKIIEALSGAGPSANRFLVGDVKQSIYRFRLANPKIFQRYIEEWGGAENSANEIARIECESLPMLQNQTKVLPLPFIRGEGRGEGSILASEVQGRAAPVFRPEVVEEGQAIPLVENFRSREGVLNFINSLFELIMRPQIGGVAYDERTKLRFGAPEARAALAQPSSAPPRVELHVRIKSKSNYEPEEGEFDEAMAEVQELADADREARLLALRLRELKEARHEIWDKDLEKFRPVEWRDIAILLRSPGNKAESYAKEFARLQVPLQVSRAGFYSSLEISDLLCLLQLLDNPLQDLPLLAVLRSPLVGLGLDELARIRLTIRRAHFWKALLQWHAAQMSRAQSGEALAEPETYRKVDKFLGQFAHWRRLARQVSLSRSLEAVLSETHYSDWLLTQPRGEQRQANVQRLVGLAQRFDQFQRQGLFRFLHFIEAQQAADAEPEVAAASTENAVRLLSIHGSKGLEFPVVVVADLGKQFNLSDLKEQIILDEQYGLCPQIKPPESGKSYPSLPYWLASRRQHLELLGEELRLLYVAMTRARDTLILSANVTASSFDKLWKNAEAPVASALLSARTFADWVGLWFAHNVPHEAASMEGRTDLLRWQIHDDAQMVLRLPQPKVPTPSPAATDAQPNAAVEKLRRKLAWQYPYGAATWHPAKLTVSALRKAAAGLPDEDNAVTYAEPRPRPYRFAKTPNLARPLEPTPEAIGNVHHLFLEHVSLSRVGSAKELKQEAERLVFENIMTAEESRLLDFKGLAAFWASEPGKLVLSQSAAVRRELEFTVRFEANELMAFKGGQPDPTLAKEFAVVQGIVDLAVLLADEIWIVDFKTGGSSDLEFQVKQYEAQMKLYGLALDRIYRRPVTRKWLYFLSSQKAIEVV